MTLVESLERSDFPGRITLISMAPLFPALLLLHPVATIGWKNFSVHPSTVIGIVALGALYSWRARVHMRRAATEAPAQEREGPSIGQRTLFASGLLVLFLSLNGPLHDLSDSYLFAAHMVQHLLLTLVVPPLLILGTPGWMLRPALRARWVDRWARRVTGGRAAFLIFNVVLASWHLPPLYNLAMANHDVHIVEHLMFLVSATLMWWPLTSPLPELPRLAYPGQMLYCFLMTIPMTIVAFCISLADHLLYPAYAAAPRIWGITPLVDQAAGGLIMWVPGTLFFLVVLSIVFFKWVGADSDSAEGAQVNWQPSPHPTPNR
jgi:putative membrane protein